MGQISWDIQGIYEDENMPYLPPEVMRVVGTRISPVFDLSEGVEILGKVNGVEIEKDTVGEGEVEIKFEIGDKWLENKEENIKEIADYINENQEIKLKYNLYAYLNEYGMGEKFKINKIKIILSSDIKEEWEKEVNPKLEWEVE